ncbi:hypothetical protein [Pseudogemmobacter humi]|uniref:Peptidase C-terminal archaeal/bacterial domain-containing protein n=1 Tax=Pseudogemmobacter humi TaxID=2483812 RepID=A0A3P5XCI8_9RHOB|nr:hypothetical protein [Pseudogemmobacter humi]VDC25234.1 hypothetical protein XINFAN_01472 [Pseudogemmobacter humi]
MRPGPLCLMLALALHAPAICAAETTRPNVDPTAQASPGPVATLALAHELYALGKAQGDALTVLAAAKLAASVGTEAGGGLKKTTTGEAVGEAGTAPPPPGAEEMFALALDLAQHDDLLSGLVLDARAATGRGRIGGAVSHDSGLAGGRTDTWEIPFKGREYAEISVIGGGGSNLDIVVTDENGNVICFEGGPEDVIYCDFVPVWDGFFYVAVENSGGAQNSYSLITN